MPILDWEGIALIIGSGDICTQLSKHLTSISPNLEVIVCGRTIKSINGIYLDLRILICFTCWTLNRTPGSPGPFGGPWGGPGPPPRAQN